MKVEFTDDGGCWLEVRAGRSKYFPPKHEVTLAAKKAIKENRRPILDGLIKTKRAFAAGTHEPVVYYRDEENNICIPPDPNIIPKGAERLEIKSLKEADALCREMSLDLKQRFMNDATPILDDMARDELGRTPREIIVAENMNAKTDYGREVTHEMLRQLDKEERDRVNISGGVHFHWREFDN